MSPPISLGLPVYNGIRWLPDTVGSVLAQDMTDFELIISDNASTDGTEAWCRDLAARDSRVRYVRNVENVGVSKNFNRSFLLARAPLFKWVSCGDLLAPDALSAFKTVLDARPEVVLAYSTTCLFENTVEDGALARDPFDLDVPDPVVRFERYIRGVRLNNIFHGLIRAAALRRTRLYRQFLSSDYNLFARLCLVGPAVQLPEAKLFRRMAPETASRFFTQDAARRYYDPSGRVDLSRPLWSSTSDYLAVPFSAGLSVSERLRLADQVFRMVWWKRRELVRELGAH